MNQERAGVRIVAGKEQQAGLRVKDLHRLSVILSDINIGKVTISGGEGKVSVVIGPMT